MPSHLRRHRASRSHMSVRRIRAARALAEPLTCRHLRGNRGQFLPRLAHASEPLLAPTYPRGRPHAPPRSPCVVSIVSPPDSWPTRGRLTCPGAGRLLLTLVSQVRRLCSDLNTQNLGLTVVSETNRMIQYWARGTMSVFFLFFFSDLGSCIYKETGPLSKPPPGAFGFTWKPFEGKLCSP